MGWAEDLRKAEEDQIREARLRRSHQMDFDPDEAAKVYGLAAATGLPQEVVAADVPGLDKAVRSNSFDYKAYTDEENGSPIFNRFAEESPYNYAVLERDRQHMTQVERSINDVWLGYKSGRATTQLADLRNIDIAQGGATPEQKERMDELNKLLEGGDFGAEGHIMKLLVGTARQAPIQAKLIYEAADEMMLGGMAGAVAGGVIGASATPMLAGSGALPGVLAGWGMGMGSGAYSGRTMAAFELERGLAFDQYIRQGFDRKDALMFSNAVGSVNAVLESFGAGALVKRVPGFRKIMKDRVGDAVAEIFTKPTIKHAIARGTIQYGEAVMTEVITEVMQDTTLMMAEEHMKTVARDVSGDTRPEMAMGTMPLFEQWKATAIHTLYGTLILSSAAPIMNYKADAKKAKDAAARQEAWSRLKEGADNSETKKKAKTLWDNFIERMEKDGPVKDVRYSRQAWTEYWQSEKMDPDEVLRELGVDPEKLDVLDDDIVIPFTTFVDKIVPSNHFTGLQKDLRVGADEMTMRESQAWFAKQDEILKATRLEIDGTETRSVLRDMEEDLTGMLMGAGQFTREAARPQAHTLALQIYNLATQEGKDPKALTAQYLAGIRRQVPESLTPGDFDPQIDPLLNSIREGDFPKQREIYGDDIIDMMRGAGGILDDGGEMSSRDIQRLYPGLVSKTGRSIDDMAEQAFEAGYIKERDETLFLEALDKQIMGSPVYSAQRAPNVALEEYLGKLEEAAQFLEQENIDITNLSNKEVRDLMTGIQTLDQSSGQSLKEWTELVMAVTTASENLSAVPNTFDTMLAQAEAQMPRVSANQDFKDVEFTDRVSETETVTYSAQERYNNAVKSRNVLKQLAKCING